MKINIVKKRTELNQELTLFKVTLEEIEKFFIEE